MSYDIMLHEAGKNEAAELDAPHHMMGGTYQVGGSPTAELNITYNYGKHYYRVFGENGIRTIYGMSGADSIPLLKDAIDQLGDERGDDYWGPTEGNAKNALRQLLALAQMRPDCFWNGD